MSWFQDTDPLLHKGILSGSAFCLKILGDQCHQGYLLSTRKLQLECQSLKPWNGTDPSVPFPIWDTIQYDKTDQYHFRGRRSVGNGKTNRVRRYLLGNYLWLICQLNRAVGKIEHFQTGCSTSVQNPRFLGLRPRSHTSVSILQCRK